MFGDYHIHTHFSSDSEASPSEYIEKAISMGMKELYFTDHMDFDYPYEDGKAMFQLDADAYFKELLELKEQYRDRIKVKIGVELGLGSAVNARNSEFSKKYDFDFVIGSSLMVGGIDPYYPAYWENRTVKEAIMTYFENVLRNVTSYKDYDVYGHLDYIRRYVPDKPYVYVDDDFYEITDMILKNIISNGKGIELNTRGLSNGITYYIPTITLLRRFKKLGGEIVTVGSDAHFNKDFGYAFKTAKDILINTGFKYITTFENRTPSFVPLNII